MRVQNWNRMQNEAGLVVFYQCEEHACMLHISLLRTHFSQNVKYWYEISGVHVLVPILHAL